MVANRNDPTSAWSQQMAGISVNCVTGPVVAPPGQLLPSPGRTTAKKMLTPGNTPGSTFLGE